MSVKVEFQYQPKENVVFLDKRKISFGEVVHASCVIEGGEPVFMYQVKSGNQPKFNISGDYLFSSREDLINSL
jgi:hypothetical protein